MKKILIELLVLTGLAIADCKTVTTFPIDGEPTITIICVDD